MTEYFVAIDGGGTGTRVRAYLPDRSLLGEAESGASSLSLGIEQAWDNINIAIQQAITTHSVTGQPSKIVAGLAGSRNVERCHDFIDWVSQSTNGKIHWTICSDAYTSALGALGNQSGIVLAIGTGMGACAIDENYQPHYTSGWGFKVGDEGAGSWMGLQAVQAYLKHIDGRKVQDSVLFEDMAKRLGAEVDLIQQWCLTATATDFATFAKPIMMHANENDVLACHIVQNAIEEILQVIHALEPFAPNSPLVLLGGLGQSMQTYLPEAVLPRIIPAKGNALDGATTLLFKDCPTELMRTHATVSATCPSH